MDPFDAAVACLQKELPDLGIHYADYGDGNYLVTYVNEGRLGFMKESWPRGTLIVTMLAPWHDDPKLRIPGNEGIKTLKYEVPLCDPDSINKVVKTLREWGQLYRTRSPGP